MTRDQLRQAGEALFGPHWQSPLARALGMSDRHMRRLASGEAPITEGMAADIRRLLAERRATIDTLIGPDLPVRNAR